MEHQVTFHCLQTIHLSITQIMAASHNPTPVQTWPVQTRLDLTWPVQTWLDQTWPDQPDLTKPAQIRASPAGPDQNLTKRPAGQPH